MRKFVRGLLIFSVILFVAGAGFAIAGFAMGVTSGDVLGLLEKYIPNFEERWNSEEDILFHADSPDKEFTEEKDSENSLLNGIVYEYSADEVMELELDFTNVKCRILPSEDDMVRVNVEDKTDEVAVTCSAGMLEVICNPEFWKSSETVSIEVHLPENHQLAQVYMTAGAGLVSIETDIMADEVFLEMGAGKINGSSKVTAKEFRLEIGAGNGDFSMIDASDIHVENAAGTTKLILAGQKEMYYVKMEMAAGTVKYGDESYSGLAHEFSDRPKDAVKSIEIECAAGSVNVAFENSADMVSR